MSNNQRPIGKCCKTIADNINEVYEEDVVDAILNLLKFTYDDRLKSGGLKAGQSADIFCYHAAGKVVEILL